METVNTTEFEILEVNLTPSVIKNVESVKNEIKRLERELQNQVILLLDGFAQGSGIKENQEWSLSEDGTKLLFRDKVVQEAE